MDAEKLIKRIKCPQIHSCPMDGEYPSCAACQKSIKQEAATALSTLQDENEKLRAELEQVKAELNAAKSPEVLEAVDELMEFARTRMSTADWLYYVDVLGEWRGQKED